MGHPNNSSFIDRYAKKYVIVRKSFIALPFKFIIDTIERKLTTSLEVVLLSHKYAFFTQSQSIV